jgi:hypothetical protein
VLAVFRLVSVLVLVLSLGLHWALLQTVAWSGMLISFSRSGSFNEAVAKTFDGQHPCPLCKVVRQGRAQERQQSQKQLNPGPKLELGLVWQPTSLTFTSDRELIPAERSPVQSRSDEPPKPRPRTVRASAAIA